MPVDVQLSWKEAKGLSRIRVKGDPNGTARGRYRAPPVQTGTA